MSGVTHFGDCREVMRGMIERGEVLISDTVPSLSAGGGEPGQGYPAVAFSAKDHGADATEECAPTLRSGSHRESHQNGGIMPAVAFKPSHYTPDKDGALSEIALPLTADADKGDQDPEVAVQSSQSGVRLSDTVGTLDANYGSRRHNGVMQNMQVRRLTPVECERLQGFPDNYTRIPWRNRYKCLDCGERFQDKYATGAGLDAGVPAECPRCREERNILPETPDGPRYKALGNSMAVPVMRWIGERIQQADRIVTEHKTIESLADLNCGGKRSSA